MKTAFVNFIWITLPAACTRDQFALDFDHRRNALHWGRDRAAFAHPDYQDWWKCWEDEGWISLGRKRNFDWIHVQVARLPE